MPVGGRSLRFVQGGDGHIQGLRAEAGEQRQLGAAGAAEVAVQVSDEAYCAGVPWSHSNVSSGTPIHVVTRPPLVRRQIEQWQWAISRSGAAKR